MGDILGNCGGAEDAIRNRVKCAWGKFKELPVFTLRGTSLKMKGKLYTACVQSVLMYHSETWAMKVADRIQLERNERMMIRWMCGATLKERSSQEMLDCLGIESVT